MPESSAAASPPIRKNLKRSASKASLPTPPRTHKKLARGRSRGSCDSDSDDKVALPSEDAFWLAPPVVTPKITSSTEEEKVEEERGEEEKPCIPSPPSTPKRRSTRRTARDSPENPFLATPGAVGDSPGVTESSADPSPHTPSYDKPFVTYVFRGTRRTYQNPHYNHAEGRPLSPTVASKLPIDHPEYSPSEACPPKRLFRRKDKKSAGPGCVTRSRANRRSLSASSNEGAGSSLEIRPKKLDFKGSGSGNKSSGKRTRDAARNLAS